MACGHVDILPRAVLVGELDDSDGRLLTGSEERWEVRDQRPIQELDPHYGRVVRGQRAECLRYSQLAGQARRLVRMRRALRDRLTDSPCSSHNKHRGKGERLHTLEYEATGLPAWTSAIGTAPFVVGARGFNRADARCRLVVPQGVLEILAA